MGLFDIFSRTDINAGVEKWRQTAGATLIDVRSAGEYGGGHIPGSLNLPLDQINKVETKIPNKNTPLFVHCLSGARSGQAVRYLKQIGYSNVRNIGGISSYKGEVKR